MDEKGVNAQEDLETQYITMRSSVYGEVCELPVSALHNQWGDSGAPSTDAPEKQVCLDKSKQP